MGVLETVVHDPYDDPRAIIGKIPRRNDVRIFAGRAVRLPGVSQMPLIRKQRIRRLTLLHPASDLLLEPFLDTEKHGVFATRAPRRPNPIGLSIVRILSIHANVIDIAGADMIDATPLLDIKPYMKQFDIIEQSTSGWLDASEDKVKNTKSDSRFIRV